MFDISLRFNLEPPECQRVIDEVAAFQDAVKAVCPGIYWSPINAKGNLELGLHVTLFEFMTEYRPELTFEKRKELFENAKGIVTQAISELDKPLKIKIGQPLVLPSALVISLDSDVYLEMLAKKLGCLSMDQPQFNVGGKPRYLHMTVGRFVTVPDEHTLHCIEEILNRTKISQAHFEVKKVDLAAMTLTPSKRLEFLARFVL